MKKDKQIVIVHCRSGQCRWVENGQCTCECTECTKRVPYDYCQLCYPFGCNKLRHLPQPPNESKCCSACLGTHLSDDKAELQTWCANPSCSCHHILVNNSAGYPILAPSCVPTPTNREWEKEAIELCKQVDDGGPTFYYEMTDFIRSLLLSEREAYRSSLCEKIEGMRKRTDRLQGQFHVEAVCFNQGLDAALDKAIEIIRGKG